MEVRLAIFNILILKFWMFFIYTMNASAEKNFRCWLAFKDIAYLQIA